MMEGKMTPEDFSEIMKNVKKRKLRKIGAGAHGEIYKMCGTPYAVKFLNPSVFPENRLAQAVLGIEYFLQKRLYDNNVSVPKPIGIMGVYHPKYREFRPGLIMEEIQTSLLSRILNSGKIRVGWHEEVEKANSKGIVVYDSSPQHNTMWDKVRKKVVLHDCISWREEVK